MRKFKLREAVVIPDGRVGRISRITYHFGHQFMAEVQFGADGPFQQLDIGSLRWATPEEIKVAIPGTG